MCSILIKRLFLKKFLKPSGYILLTTFDGSVVNKSFDETGHITTYYTTQEGEKKIMFDVVKKYSPDIKDFSVTGIPIDVHLPSFEDGVYYTEYLVNPDLMIKTMAANGFRLDDTDLFSNVFYKHKHFFDNVAKDEEKEENRKWFMKVKEFYNQEDPVNKSCFTYSKLNRYYVFQNEDDGSVKPELESKKYEFKPDKSKFNKDKRKS